MTVGGPNLRVVHSEAAAPGREPRFLKVADAIGRRLTRDAIWSGERCNWLVWSKEPVGGAFTSVYRAAGLDLYMGVAGIALYLAHLSTLTGDRAQQETLAGASHQLCAQLERADFASCGYYTGVAGAGHALVAIGEAIGEAAWVDRGLAALERVAGGDMPPLSDLLSGVAGIIPTLAATGVRYGRPALVDAAERMADELVARGQLDDAGLSWPSGAGERRNLLGLSHGASGAALALYELDIVRPNARRRRAATEAIRYERTLYDAARRNWPDYREFPGLDAPEPQHPVAWCHGSTGVGLCRLRLLQLAPEDPELMPEIDVALGNAVAMLNQPIPPIGGDFTLCHGVTGNSELVLEVGARLGRADCIDAARRVGDVGIQLFEATRSPWPCGIAERGESPTLMLGAAGIGLHYLRLYQPLAAPSVLLPPAVASDARPASREPLSADAG